jgi:hypothetical protein
MLAAPVLIGRSMTNYWAGVRGNENRINQRWWPNKKINGHMYITKVRDQNLSFARFRSHLNSHWSLPLRATFKPTILCKVVDCYLCTSANVILS